MWFFIICLFACLSCHPFNRHLIAGTKVAKSSSFQNQNLSTSFSRNSGEKKFQSSSADDAKTLTNVEVIEEGGEEANAQLQCWSAGVAEVDVAEVIPVREGTMQKVRGHDAGMVDRGG
eukprot:jgi/Bigna1/128536/aug1.6_g3244